MSHEQFAVWATMEARPGKEDQARAFLREAARRLGDEPGTTNFYAMEIGDGHFAIFNLFTDEDALRKHVEGAVAEWVQESQPELFTKPYEITRTRILTTKLAELDRAKLAG